MRPVFRSADRHICSIDQAHGLTLFWEVMSHPIVDGIDKEPQPQSANGAVFRHHLTTCTMC